MKKLVLSVLFLISLVLASNLVLADYTINSFDFKVGDHEVTHVLYQHVQVVDLFVNFTTNESFTTLHADLTVLNPDPKYYGLYRDHAFLCDLLDNPSGEVGEYDYNCRILSVVFNPQSTSFDINMTFHGSMQNVDMVHQKTFQLDETRPQLKRFETEYCLNEKCYLPSAMPAKIYIEMTDGTSSFHQEKVFYQINGNRAQRVINCEGSLCEGIYTQPGCEGGDRLEAQIVSAQGVMSSDDAGNALEGELKRTFICDQKKPGDEYFTIDITHSGGEIYPEPKAGDTVTINVTVSEDASAVSASMNLSSMGGNYVTQNCQTNPGGLDSTCLFNIPNVKAGDYNLEVHVEDLVGRTNSKQFMVHVDEYIILDDGVTPPEFFRDIKGETPATQGYNRIALQLAKENNIDYPMYVSFTPQRNLGIGGSVEILYTDIYDADKYKCDIYQNGKRSESSAISAFRFTVANKVAKYDEENKINLKLLMDPNDLEDNSEIVCNVSVILRVDGDKVYREPDIFELRMPVKFKNSRLGDDAPGERYVQKIDEFKKSTKATNDLIGLMNTLYSTMQDLCDAQKFLVSMSQGAVTLETFAAAMQNQALSQVFTGVSQVAQTTETVASNARHTANKLVVEEDLKPRTGWAGENLPREFSFKGILSDACRISTCSVDKEQDDKTDFIFDGDEPAAKLFENYESNPTSDEKTSTTPSTNTVKKDKKESDLEDVVSEEDKTKVEADAEFKGVKNPYLDAGLSKILEDVNVPDVKSSLISAVGARCLPAVVYHLNQYRQMNCQTIVCMKSQAIYGTDVSVCEQAKAQFICEKIVGEAFDIGGVRIIKNVMDNTNAFVQGLIPNTLDVIMKNTYCKGYADITDDFLGDSYKSEDIPSQKVVKLAVCSVPEVVGKAINLKQKATSSKKIFEYKPEEDSCDLAYCEEGDEECAKKASGSLIERLAPGLKIPQTSLQEMGNNLFTQEIEVEPDNRYKGKTEAEIADLRDKMDEQMFEMVYDEQRDKPLTESQKSAYKVLFKSSTGDIEYSEFVSVYQERLAYVKAKFASIYTDEAYKSSTGNKEVSEAKYLAETILASKDRVKNMPAGEVSAWYEKVKLGAETAKTDYDYELLYGDLITGISNEDTPVINTGTTRGGTGDETSEEFTVTSGMTYETFLKQYYVLVEEVRIGKDPINIANFIYKSNKNGISDKPKSTTDEGKKELDWYTGLVLDSSIILNYNEALTDIRKERSEFRVKNLAPIQLKLSQVGAKLIEIERLYAVDKETGKKHSVYITSSADTKCEGTRITINENDLVDFLVKSSSYSALYPYVVKGKADGENVWLANLVNLQQSVGLEEGCQDVVIEVQYLLGLDRGEVLDYYTLLKYFGDDSNTQPLAENVYTDSELFDKYEKYSGTLPNKLLAIHKLYKEVEVELKTEEKGATALYIKEVELTKIYDEALKRISNPPGTTYVSTDTDVEDVTNPIEALDAESDALAKEYIQEQQETIDKLEQAQKDAYENWKKCGGDRKCEQLYEEKISLAEEEIARLKKYVGGLVDDDGVVDVRAIKDMKREQLKVKKAQVRQLVDVVATMAVNKGWLNWASLTSYGSNTTFGKLSDWSDTWLNSDNYKNKICSANFIKPKDSTSNDGAAIQCEDGLCVPVLTMAVEKTVLNDTHKLYTATYMIGNIRSPDMFSEEEVMNFNVFFKDGNVISEKLFNSSNGWLQVSYNQLAGDTFAFISRNEFTEMCLFFERRFPPHEIKAEKEYCRPVVENLVGESDFDTGAPVPANYNDQAETIVKTSPGSSPMNII